MEHIWRIFYYTVNIIDVKSISYVNLVGLLIFYSF